jgi:predicted nucleotidyltransferase
MTQLSTQDQSLLVRFLNNRPVRKAYLFGHYAPLKPGRQCDLDILVEMEQTNDAGLELYGFRLELERLLKKKVGLVSVARLSARVRQIVDRDKVLIFEKGKRRPWSGTTGGLIFGF